MCMSYCLQQIFVKWWLCYLQTRLPSSGNHPHYHHCCLILSTWKSCSQHLHSLACVSLITHLRFLLVCPFSLGMFDIIWREFSLSPLNENLENICLFSIFWSLPLNILCEHHYVGIGNLKMIKKSSHIKMEQPFKQKSLNHAVIASF